MTRISFPCYKCGQNNYFDSTPEMSLVFERKDAMRRQLQEEIEVERKSATPKEYRISCSNCGAVNIVTA